MLSQINHAADGGAQGLVQRLSEELERQGQAANHHAKVIRQRESELEAALDRANRAHDELIAMEPPSLSQAIGGVEILLRVSTQPAPSMAVAAGTEEKSGPVEEDAGTGARGGQSENGQEDVWCLVRYEKAPSSSKKRGGISKETDVLTLSVEEGKGESGLEAGENALDDHGDEEGDEGAGQAPARAAVEAKVEAAKMTEEWEKHEVEGEAEQAPLTVFPSACGGDDDNAGGDAVAAAPRTAEGEDSEGQPSPPSSLPSSASVAGQDTVVVIEWRTQGEVDEWFATRLETAVEEEYYQQERSRLERAEGDAREETAAATAEASMVAPRAAVPVLETPLTIQESFAAEMARVEAELNSKLEMARAELSRNTEAHKQYRARVSKGFLFVSSVGRGSRSGETFLRTLPERISRVFWGFFTPKKLSSQYPRTIWSLPALHLHSRSLAHLDVGRRQSDPGASTPSTMTSPAASIFFILSVVIVSFSLSNVSRRPHYPLPDRHTPPSKPVEPRNARRRSVSPRRTGSWRRNASWCVRR